MTETNHISRVRHELKLKLGNNLVDKLVEEKLRSKFTDFEGLLCNLSNVICEHHYFSSNKVESGHKIGNGALFSLEQNKACLQSSSNEASTPCALYKTAF